MDPKKELKHLYQPSAKVISIVNVPPMNFLSIDGSGNPNTAPEYTSAVEAIYAMAYALKFKVKKGKLEVDYAVMPLEGLWWADDMSKFTVTNKDIWKWTMMIMQPEYVTAQLVAETLGEVAKKKDLSALSKIRFEPFHEGHAVQIMHIGPYSAEEPTVTKLHSFIRESGYELSGLHHEIYLGDPRKSAPGKLQTVIRQPFKK